MQDQINLHEFTLVALAYRCRIETSRYLNNQTHDPRYGYELFRRALEEPHKLESKQAWGFVQAQYKPLAVKWVRKHWRFKLINQLPDKFAEDGLHRMWEVFAKSPGKFTKEDFPALARLLGYLRMCVWSAINSYPLAPQGDSEVPEIAVTMPVDLDLITSQSWQCIQERLKKDIERIVAFESFINERVPREIAAIYPQLFADVKEVHRVKDTMLKRFRRNAKKIRACIEGE
jgi:hypothetical protein